MALPKISMRQLLEAGVHFGHRPHRWNPKMAPYIFGARNNIHIIDLQKTVPLMVRALEAIEATVASGGRVLFVGTKRQSADAVRAAAEKCGQYYVNHRWLGGMLTNWRTISNSIIRLKKMNEYLSGGGEGMTKKELLKMTREQVKLTNVLGGIADMGGRPDLLIVLDVNKDDLAIEEARTLGIPVVGILDTNSNPDHITYPVPGNDDALKAIELYADLFAGAVLSGIKAEIKASGADLGASENIEMLMDELPAAASTKS